MALNDNLLSNKQHILYKQLNLKSYGVGGHWLDSGVYMILSINWNYSADNTNYNVGNPSNVAVYFQSDGNMYMYIAEQYTTDRYIRIAYVKA